MRESVLRGFISGEVAINDLVRDLRGSVTQVSSIESAVEIEDMPESFLLARQHVMMLCDAALSKTLTSEDLTTVAFALMASDHFEWEDEILSEVLSDWSCPEVNFPLDESTLRMHRSWLAGDAHPSARMGVASNNGRLISVRRKVPRKLDRSAEMPDHSTE
jgi:hypothetical protein